MSPQQEQKSDCLQKKLSIEGKEKKDPVKTLMEENCEELSGVFLTRTLHWGSAEIREAKTGHPR